MSTNDDLQSPIGLQSLFGEESTEVQKITVSHSTEGSAQKIETPEEKYSNSVKRYGRQPSGFVGLENQGSTCYLNSIVQCLYMTPEIRSTMFKLSKEDLNLDAPPEDFEKKKDEKKDEKKEEKKNELSFEYFMDMGFKKSSIEQAFKKCGRKESDHDQVINQLLNDPNASASEEEKKKDLEELKKEEEKKKEEERKKEEEAKKNSEKKPKKPKIIPIHIQKLFAQLKLAEKPYVSTEELTKAFGWKSSHVYFEQHDVQELTRVLFEVLRDQLKKTQHKDLMNLFKGQTSNRVTCQKCGYIGEVTEDFVDLTLIIKGFGYNTSSVHEGLTKLLEVENLTGDNRYSCPKCEEKTDAKKGLVIKSLPPLLIFSLNRFEYDWSKGGERKKINNKYEYHESINMKDYIDDNEVNNNLTKDETTYELFAVIIHVGTPTQGHYHCYTKDLLGEGKSNEGDFNNKKPEKTSKAVWYDFNDKYVLPITFDDVKKQQGSDDAKECAYMLLYRRKDMSKYKDYCDNLDKIPEHLEKEIKEINEKAEKERKDAEFEETIYRMNFYVPEFFIAHGEYLYACNYDFVHGGGKTYKQIVAKKNSTIKELKTQIRKEFGEDVVPENFKFYYLEKQLMMMSADRHKIVKEIEEDQSLTLRKSRFLQSRIHILCATVETLGKVSLAKGGEMELRLYKFTSAKEPNSNTVGFPPTATFKSFLGALETYFKIKKENIVLYKMRFRQQPQLIQVEDDNIPLFALEGFESCSISIEDKTAQGNENCHFVMQSYLNEHNEITLFMTDKVTDRNDSQRTERWNPDFTFKGKKDWTVNQLKLNILKQIQDYHKSKKEIDPTQVVLRRNSHMGPGNIIEKEERKLEEAKVDNYDRLIIELCYTEEKIELTFIEIPENSKDQSEKWKMEVETKWTIKQLKEKLVKLSPKKFVSVHDFRLREDSHYHNIAGNIISDEEFSIAKLNLRNGDLVYCELGSPPIKEMIGIKIYGAKWPPKESSKLPGDPRACSFERYARMSEFSTFKQLKKKIMDYYEFKSPGTEYVRVRFVTKEKEGYYRVGQVINNQNYYRSLKKLKFIDDIVVAVQVLTEPDKEQAETQDNVESDDEKTETMQEHKEDTHKKSKKQPPSIYLTIRKRIPSEKKFDKGIELFVQENSLLTIDAFKKELGKYYPNIKPENMTISKFCFEEKKWKNFFGPEDEETKKKTLRQKYGLKDGDVIIVKDEAEDEKHEDPFYEIIPLVEEKDTSYHSSYSYSRPKSPEKQLKIEYDREDE